jgi:hypothetical protein
MFVNVTPALNHTLDQIANLSEVIENGEDRIKELKAEASRVRKLTTDEFYDTVSRTQTKGGYLASLKGQIYGIEQHNASLEAYKLTLMSKLAA